MKKKSVYALVDCNSFFCSCERVFNPKLENKPIIVLSNNDGCAVSRTDEAKALGIKMGAPYFQIKNFCDKHQVHVFSSNYALYGDMSRRVMRTLSDFTPDLEIYSIDEAFLSLTGFQNLSEYALKIKSQVQQYTGIPVSIGIGPTKVLAKLTNMMAKKEKKKTNGVVNYFEIENFDEKIKQIPVQEIWGIGRKSSEKLAQYQIKSVYDFKCADEHLIQKLLTIVGLRIQKELKEEECLSLESIRDKKQIISSRSFGQPVYELDEIKESVASHISQAAEKLREQDSICSSIMVYIHTNRFKNTPQYYNSNVIHMLSGTASTPKMIHYAFEALEKIYRKNYEYKKAGIVLMDIQKKTSSQLDFFSTHDSKKDDELMKVMDLINQKQGSGTVKFAACGLDQMWKMLSEMKSRNYSSRWSELLEVF